MRPVPTIRIDRSRDRALVKASSIPLCNGDHLLAGLQPNVSDCLKNLPARCDRSYANASCTHARLPHVGSARAGVCIKIVLK
jgi:hypothetical protein